MSKWARHSLRVRHGMRCLRVTYSYTYFLILSFLSGTCIFGCVVHEHMITLSLTRALSFSHTHRKDTDIPALLKEGASYFLDDPDVKFVPTAGGVNNLVQYCETSKVYACVRCAKYHAQSIFLCVERRIPPCMLSKTWISTQGEKYVMRIYNNGGNTKRVRLMLCKKMHVCVPHTYTHTWKYA